MGNRPDFCRNTTAISNETSYAYLSECWTEKVVADILRKSLPLIILPVSLICNCLSFLALRSRHMRGTSTAFFMLALSVLDPLVLLTKNLVYFPTFVAAYAFSCRLLYFLIYVLGYTNVWILVIMTADKFFAVWFPLKVSYFCTITRAKYVCVFLLAMTSIISFHHFWTIDSLRNPQDPKQRFCYYDTSRYGVVQRLSRYVDFVIWCFLPFVLILTLSVLIIYKLRQKRRDAHQTIRQTVNSAEVSGTLLSKQHQQKRSGSQSIEMRSNQKTDVIRSRHRHITLMLLAVAVVFLFLTLPNSIYFVLDITYGFNKAPTVNDFSQWLRYRRLNILTVVMFQLSDLQHATNFFLYLLTSDKFRRSLVMICSANVTFLSSILMCWRRHKTGSSSSLQNQSLSQKPERGHTMSFRSSASDMSSISINPRCTSTRSGQQQQQQQRKPSNKSRPVTSKSTSATESS